VVVVVARQAYFRAARIARLEQDAGRVGGSGLVDYDVVPVACVVLPAYLNRRGGDATASRLVVPAVVVSPARRAGLSEAVAPPVISDQAVPLNA
jgi:hypothetical protein